MEGLSLSEDKDLLLFRPFDFDRDLEEEREDLEEDRLEEEEERERDRDRALDRDLDLDLDTDEEYFDRFRLGSLTTTGVLLLGPSSQSERFSSGFGRGEERLTAFEELEGVSFVVIAEDPPVARAGSRFESTVNI